MKKAIRIFVILVLVGLFGGTLYFLYQKSRPVVVTILVNKTRKMSSLLESFQLIHFSHLFA